MQLKNDSNPVVASFVGMEPAEFHPEKDSDNIIALITDHASLDEVVVVWIWHSKTTKCHWALQQKL